MGGGKSPEIVALENQLLALAKSYQTFIAEATQKAVAEFTPHQKAIGLLMPKIIAANKGEKVVFTPEEQATLKNAAAAAKQFENASGIFTPKNLAALATQINNAKGIQATANKYAQSDAEETVNSKLPNATTSNNLDSTTNVEAKNEDYNENNPIKNGVGRALTNAPEDVRTVQRLLKLSITGVADDKLFAAIEAHQQKCELKVDGKIAPNGETWISLLLGRKASRKEKDMLVAAPKIEEYNNAITKAAGTLAIDATKLKAIIAAESEGDENANKGKESQYKGFMQMNETSWKEGVEWLKKNKEIDYSSLSFEKSVYDPEIAVLVGGATFLKKSEYMAKAGITKEHSEWEVIMLMAYNAGQGTIIEAIRLAGGSTDVDIFTQERYLRDAIKTKIKKLNGDDLTEAEVDAKYAEITGYAQKARAYETVANLGTANNNAIPIEKKDIPKKTLEPNPDIFGGYNGVPKKSSGANPSIFSGTGKIHTEPLEDPNLFPDLKNKRTTPIIEKPQTEIVDDRIIYAVQVLSASSPASTQQLAELNALASEVGLNLYSGQYNGKYCYWLTGNNWVDKTTALGVRFKIQNLGADNDKLALKGPYHDAFVIATKNGQRVEMPK
jgi:hypothetical protein